MSAVWTAARAAVRRRRLQTLIIGIVVLCSTGVLVVALQLLAASTGPFDQAFDAQQGAHVVATFDNSRTNDAQLAQTSTKSGVAAAAGPFEQATLTVPQRTPDQAKSLLQPGPLTVVGRADPAGPVDDVNLWRGRWATAPGEIVLNFPTTSNLPPNTLGSTVTVPGYPPLTVVGFAYTVSQSADAWVTPATIATLHPNAIQMLYRFNSHATTAQLHDALAGATNEVPQDSLQAAQTYLALKAAFNSGAGAYVPFLIAFGVLGLVVAVLIVANVVSGMVVSGFQHIGILKSLGFSPNQVVAIYLTMISLPSVAGALVGTVVGTLLARPLLNSAFQTLGQAGVSVSLWVDAAALIGMPALVVLAAALPALRAHRLSAAQAISAGSAPARGRGQGVQRRLSGTRLPRSVSLGLGLPFARPARTLLTMAAIVLGVTTVTLSTGLINTITAYGNAAEQSSSYQVVVTAGIPRTGQNARTLSDPDAEAMLRSLPGATHVTATSDINAHLVGSSQAVDVLFYRGDSAATAPTIVKGHWIDGDDQAVVSPSFLHQRGLAVGDAITVDTGTKQARLTIVGERMNGDPNGVNTGWSTLAQLGEDHPADIYDVQLAAGADLAAYSKAVQAHDPGLYPAANDQTNAGTEIVTSFSTLFTAMLAVVAALGVFNTVVLNTRERRRDLGMLKSIGMTPRQVTAMVVTSMAGLGVVGGLLGLPLGVLAHKLIVPAATKAGNIVMPASMMNVWHIPVLVLLGFAGLLIAVLGAFLPARSASRLTIAQVLRNE